MDLGQGRLRRSGINSLLSASHSDYGLAWTDGKGVFMSPVCMIDDQLQNNPSTLLGTFECVHSVSWCMAGSSSQESLMAVVHDTSVTIWKVENIKPDLTFRQIRKITISAIPQGCLWNPVKDLLCLLTLHQCSLYFRHLSDKGSFVLPNIDSGKVKCGCWSQDGLKLIVGVGSLVLIYQWKDIEKVVTDYSMNACKIPNVTGALSSLAAISSSRFIAATELPLDRLCHNSQAADLFRLPDLNESNNRSNDSCNDTELHSVSEGSSLSNIQRLFNIHQSSPPVSRCDSSQLVLFEVRDFGKTDSLRKLADVNLAGFITPDLLYINCLKKQIVVGSNVHHKLYIFNIVDHQLLLSCDLNLANNERPKGLCGHPQSGINSNTVLVMVGQAIDTHSVFVPSTIYSDYRLSVRLISTVQDKTSHSRMHISSKNDLSDQIHSSCYGSNACKYSVPSGQSSPSSEFDVTTSGDETGLRLLSTQTPHPLHPVIQVLGEERNVANSSLEMEYTDFRKMPAKFNSDSRTQRFLEKDCEWPSPRNDVSFGQESLSDKRSSLKQLSGSMPGVTVAEIDSCKAAPIVSASNGKVSFANGNMSTRGAEFWQHQPGSSNDRFDGTFADLKQQIELLRSELSYQAEQTSAIKLKVEDMYSEISRNGSRNVRRSAMNPDLIYLVDSSGLQKAFVLDNGRLQLEMVKHAFSLTTVELVINGVACVVGADRDGYIPLDFITGQIIHIAAPSVSAFRI